MIRLIDSSGNPFWINPKAIDMIHFHTGYSRVEIIWHSGGSCCSESMDGSVDEVQKMISEAIDLKFK
jgi:uncharacterized protein YlzI (FlbEa/FlbD family)